MVFRSKRDAELTKAIYRRVPVLIKEGNPEENPWGISFLRMFDMSNDSHLFRTREQLEREGYHLVGNRFISNDKIVYLPLYEAKMIHHFDHRYGDYRDYPEGALTTALPEVPFQRLIDPNYCVLPRYWVIEAEVNRYIAEKSYVIGFRNITNPTNERTTIASIVPKYAIGHSMPIILFHNGFISCFIPNLSALIFDYIVRQKLGGTNMTFGYFMQFPILPRKTYSIDLSTFIDIHLRELTYTAWDLEPFAHDVGYDGPPFIWDEVRRFLLRCELDALYFHLYQIARDDVDYIMETFPIVKRKDEAAYGEYRTKRVILEMYDQMAALPKMSVPAPKGDGDYLVPDVSQYQTWLNPPPAHSSVAHPPKEQ